MAVWVTRDRAEAAEARVLRLERAIIEVLPRMDHWPAEAVVAGWKREHEDHSEFCPPCALKTALAKEKT